MFYLCENAARATLKSLMTTQQVLITINGGVSVRMSFALALARREAGTGATPALKGGAL